MAGGIFILAKKMDYDENHVLPERHEPSWIFLKTGPGSNRIQAKMALFFAAK
jgi:hypothetical protein